MSEENEYLWKSKKDDYVLIKSSEDSYSIFNITNNAALIIEDNEEAKFVINQMKQNGNKIVRIELLNYLLDKRPIPTLISIQDDKEVYRCSDTGEKFELNLECTPHFAPRFDLAIKWSVNIPLTKQIIHLKKIFPGIEKSTPELLQIARNSSKYVFAECLSRFQTDRIINEGKKYGLDIYVNPK
ncbi:hypothetical protein JK636_18730 [Clostridium sp. YIM B02515]|uniref:Uncharacterized protein n=1 Tax=Clostridium rhizosphaerae TaxID=2803861 RepID=A0ABS1THC1_9CLOT|nr:hypothetical protein [Clostridium rhizosphaerae]MBL4937744.1 hypothetical protein [Clostridium rhizosphaerae]